MTVGKPRWEQFNAVLFACMLMLLGVGALFLWSVSERPDLVPEGMDYRDTLSRQLFWAGTGLFTFFVALRIPSARWSSLAFPIYGLSLASLAVVLMYGTPINDARRWFMVGGTTLQPAEFMKVALVLVLARLLMFSRGAGGWTLARVLALVALPAGLVMLQPDMGTALLFIPVGVAMAFVGGVRPRLLLLVLLIGALLAGGFLKVGLDRFRAAAPHLATSKDRVWGLHAYQWRRIESHFSPETHRSAGAFQAQQARIAIGSGQWWGRGIRSGTQSQLKILPVRQSDFIYAVIGEEWGLAGTTLVLLAYGGILLGCFATASTAVEPFRRLVATGLGVMLGAEVLLNTAVVTGLLPVTGTPLPLVSQGGSSLVATCLGLGILQSLRMWPGFDLGRG